MVISQVKEWWPNIDNAISDKAIPSFRTMAEANETAKSYGWGGLTIKIERRFENCWIVGRIDFQPATEADINFRVMRVPLLRWEKDSRGIEFCPVVEFRAPYQSH